MGVSTSSYKFSSDHYNPYSNSLRPAIAAALVSAQQHKVPVTTVFSAVTPIVPANNFVLYTSGRTVFIAQPERFSQANQPFVSDFTVILRVTQRQLPVMHLVQTSSVHFRHESWLIYSCKAEKIISLSGS